MNYELNIDTEVSLRLSSYRRFTLSIILSIITHMFITNLNIADVIINEVNPNVTQSYTPDLTRLLTLTL